MNNGFGLRGHEVMTPDHVPRILDQNIGDVIADHGPCTTLTWCIFSDFIRGPWSGFERNVMKSG